MQVQTTIVDEHVVKIEASSSGEISDVKVSRAKDGSVRIDIVPSELKVVKETNKLSMNTNMCVVSVAPVDTNQIFEKRALAAMIDRTLCKTIRGSYCSYDRASFAANAIASDILQKVCQGCCSCK